MTNKVLATFEHEGKKIEVSGGVKIAVDGVCLGKTYKSLDAALFEALIKVFGMSPVLAAITRKELLD